MKLPRVQLRRQSLDIFSHLVRFKEFMCIGLTGTHLKIGIARNLPGRKEIQNLLRHDIQNRSDEEIADLMRMGLKSMKARNPAVFSLLPSHQALTKNIEIPSTNPKEIDDIIRLQAGRHTPYARDDIIVAYLNLGVHGKNYTKILLVIVKREIVKRQFSLLEMADVRLDRVIFAPEAIGRIALPVLKVDSADAPVCVLHVDADGTEFVVILRERTIFLRCIAIGSSHLASEKEKYQVMLIEEVKQSLEAYQGEDVGSPLQKLILTGVLNDSIKDICPVLEETLHIPVRAQPYAEQLTLSKEAARFVHTAQDTSFLGVLAPLLISDDLRVNMIPEEIKARRTFEERSKEIIKMGVLVMSVFIFMCGTFLGRVYFRNLYLTTLSEKYQPLNKEAQALERQLLRTRIIREYLKQRTVPLEALNQLHGLVPEGIYLTQIKFDESSGLSIKGTSQTMAAVFASVDTLENSDYFKNVKTKYATKRKEDEVDVTDFEITCLTEEQK